MVFSDTSLKTKTVETVIMHYNIDEESKKTLCFLRSTLEGATGRIKKGLEKFNKLETFLTVDAAVTVDYYFSIQTEYKDKKLYLQYLQSIILIYTKFLTTGFPDEVYDDLDHPVQKVVTYIEERYDLLVYHGEPENNAAYRRKESMKAEGKSQYTVKMESIKDTFMELLESAESENTYLPNS